ncbi:MULTISPECIES: hypothetical protein [unclassified Streptomyces]|uniref:hypothetical protein n=1 Tax=unclassified Streptomyces TaxID=2593676 RepID=UPI003D91CF02
MERLLGKADWHEEVAQRLVIGAVTAQECWLGGGGEPEVDGFAGQRFESVDEVLGIEGDTDCAAVEGRVDVVDGLSVVVSTGFQYEWAMGPEGEPDRVRCLGDQGDALDGGCERGDLDWVRILLREGC